MSLRLIQAVAETENLDDFHLGRLLVLLASADARKSTPATKAKAVEGITKLAKLDFLLRYPTALERALIELGRDPADAKVQSRERSSIEAKMVRFRYGPWDARYRRWLVFSRRAVSSFWVCRAIRCRSASPTQAERWLPGSKRIRCSPTSPAVPMWS
jgi:hypothetical protein